MDNFFPVEISVISSNALCNYIREEYFPNWGLKCRLFYRGLHDIYKVVTEDEEFFFKVYRQGIRLLTRFNVKLIY